jgi:hypothetical protein
MGGSHIIKDSQSLNHPSFAFIKGVGILTKDLILYFLFFPEYLVGFFFFYRWNDDQSI